MSANSLYAMSWASHDSVQWNAPASGAMMPRMMRRPPKGSPFLTARTVSALTTPTPMKVNTRAMPNMNVTMSCA